MNIDWLRVGLLLVQGMSGLIVWARERQLIDLGAQEALANAMRRQAEELDKVREARTELAAARDAGRLRDVAEAWISPARADGHEQAHSNRGGTGM